MGPITLFDKSFLQSLHIDEAVWFDNFYSTNIAPLFYIETLADLEKAVRKGRTPEQEVGIIASKTPEMHSSPNTFHQQLVIANLLGHEVTMDGRPIISGGRCIQTADKNAVMFDLPPEQEAFQRWQKGDFLEVERQYAKVWRRILSPLNFESILQIFTSTGIQPKSHSLEEARLVAESIINLKDNQESLIILAFKLFFIPEKFLLDVLQKRKQKNFPLLKDFAPYVAYVMTIEFFFYISINSHLISKKISNKNDFAYLYYLPFCTIFVSSDNLHRRSAPLFLRKDQEFVWGYELKEDLRKIDTFYDSLTKEEKENGLYKIAVYPPENEDLITARLWDRFLPSWRNHKNKHPIVRDEETEKKIVQEIKGMTESKSIDPKTVDFDSQSADAMILKKYVRMKKGKWWQLPKDLKS